MALIGLAFCLGLGGCNMRSFPPDGFGGFLNTPAPLPPPGAAPISLSPGQRAVPGMPVAPDQSYTLDSGDQIRLVVFGQENLSNVYAVDGSGHISLPLIGSVTARGLTTQQLASVIGQQLGARYIRNPKVSVEVQTYRPFFILGEVKTAGQYPYVNGMTVETAVAIAQGYTDRANERKVRLTRRFGGVMSTVLVPTDYPVKPGDTIYVLERLF